ncbi:hypothetical protein MKZ38_005723 [Zalerion maritima]|uniref:Protein kinase domain-containing protein n=1 Tax=Zalerion maritima TaxID=339359 RepID=A0AAD5RK12_9PEZI|nr:hypothetical protein MKZ38_005723 [Zalerion maritima]
MFAPNVAQVFELREKPEPTIIMAYYPQGNMVDALVLDEARRMSGFGQVLEALGHLHEKGVVHRDLKPENFLVEFKPFFKVVITDFGMANVAIEWIYDFPEPPRVPIQKQGREVAPKLWHEWVVTWARELRGTLKDEDEGEDQLIHILLHMVDFKARSRWPAKKCLMRGLEAGLFKRRMADGLIVCANYKEEDPEAGIKTPTPASPSLRASQRQSGINSDATTILDKLWDGAESFTLRHHSKYFSTTPIG